MGLKEKTVKSVKWNTIATVVTMLLQVIQLAILTRLLEKSDFGLVAIASLVISFTDIFSELGITVALIHKQNISSDEYSSVFWLNVIVSIVIFVITILSAPLVAVFYNEPRLTLIISLFALKILFNAFGKMFQTIKVKNLEFGFISKVRILTAIIGLIATVTLAYAGLGVMSMVYGQLITVGFNQLVFAITGLKTEHIRLHFSFNEVKDFLSIGLYQLGTRILDFAAARLDIFLIGKFFSMEELGLYNIAKDLVIKPYSILNSISSSVFSSSFARMQDNMILLKQSFNKLLRATSIASVFIYAVLIILSDFIVHILYAPSYMEVAAFIRIMAYVGIFSAITSQSATIMISLGRTDLGFKWTIIQIIMSVLVLIGTAPMGLYPVAVGQSVLAFVSLIVYYYIVVQPLLKNYCIWDYLNTVKSCLLSLVILLPISFFYTTIAKEYVVQFGITSIFMIILYLYTQRYDKELVSEVVGLIKRKK